MNEKLAPIGSPLVNYWCEPGCQQTRSVSVKTAEAIVYIND